MKLHSKRVEKILDQFFYVYEHGQVYHGDNDQVQKSLETSGEDVKAHSNEWRRCKSTLEMSGEDVKSHSKRVEKM